MKILYLTTVGGTMGFFRSFVKQLIDEGHTVDIACNHTDRVKECFREWGCRVYPLPYTRSPFSKGNILAIKKIRKIVTDGGYDMVHCHTPICAACTRLACKPLRKKGLKVVYTAHGFHFFKGAPLKNWLIYYPVEWLCSRWTDLLITITKDDYKLAQKRFHARKTAYVPGVGIDVAKFADVEIDKAAKRREIGVPEDAFLVLSVGELNQNKNHEAIIREIAAIYGKTTAQTNLLAGIPKENVHYAIAGKGELKDHLENLAKELGIGDRVHLLGFRGDCPELYKAADIYALPSKREGLNVSLQEATAAGLECRFFPIRGNVDLIGVKDAGRFNVTEINRQMEELYQSLKA